MNCGYVKTAWFPLSYVIIVIIIYSFTMFHYCSYYGRYSCYHFDYYCYIYIRAHHCYTSWLFSWFSAHFHLNSTAGGTFFRPGQVAGWNRGGKPHWWMVNGWWVHFESGDGWWMVGEWLVNGSPETWQSPSRSPSWHVRPCIRMPFMGAAPYPAWSTKAQGLSHWSKSDWNWECCVFNQTCGTYMYITVLSHLFFFMFSPAARTSRWLEYRSRRRPGWLAVLAPMTIPSGNLT